MKKIEKLTPSQEKQLILFREEWLNIGLCCEPANYDEAENNISFFYEKLGKKKPLFFHFSSPFMCELGLAALKIVLDKKLGSQLESQLRSQLGSQLESKLGSQLGSQLESQLGSQLGSQLRSQLRSQLESKLWGQLGSQLWGQLWSQLGSQLESQLGSQLGSQLESKLGSQLGSQLESQLGSQLRSQLESQLWSKLWGQLWSQLGSQLESQLGSQLRSQLRSQLESQLESKLGSQLGSQLESQLGSQLESQLGSQLRSQLGSQLWSQLRGQLGSQLWSKLWGQLWSQLGSQLESQLGSQLGSQKYFYYNAFSGQQSAYWQAFYLFCHEIGVKYDNDDLQILNAWGAISKSVCWWAPWEGICIISDRPRSVSFNNTGRLHNDKGMAVRFSDGWGVYCWNGVRIPGWIIENPENITIEKIDAESNAEIRRIMMNKYGMARYLEESGAKEIHRDRDTKGERILYRKEDAIGPIQIIKLENSTPERDGSKKFYTFRVNPNVKTCHEAVASLYNMNPEKYKPIIET